MQNGDHQAPKLLASNEPSMLLENLSLSNNPSDTQNPREVKRTQERRRLFDSLSASQMSNGRRYSAGDSLQPYIREPQSAYPTSTDQDGTVLEPLQEESPRDPRDDIDNSTVAKRPTSPYTRYPTVDFDGLSWPSRYLTQHRMTARLTIPGLGTRARLEATPEEAKARHEKLAGAIKTMLECIGEDPDREGLTRTPKRYAEAMMFLTKGYEENLRDIVNNAVFHEDHDEMVIIKDIEVFSLCEHHLVPFTGRVRIVHVQG